MASPIATETVRWRGFKVKGDVEIAYEQIVIAKQQRIPGQSVAEAVLEAARPADAPLHDYFEWDDTIAAEKYRLEQARWLVRHIAYIDDTKPDLPAVRAFVVVHGLDAQRPDYEETRVVLADDQLRRQLLRRAMSELEAFRQKYDRLEELVEVHRAIDTAIMREKTKGKELPKPRAVVQIGASPRRRCTCGQTTSSDPCEHCGAAWR